MTPRHSCDITVMLNQLEPWEIMSMKASIKIKIFSLEKNICKMATILFRSQFVELVSSVLFSLYWILMLFISRVCSSRASHSSCSWWATSWCSKRSLTSSCGILALAGSHTSSLSCATLSHRCDNQNITWLINSICGIFVNFLSPGHFYQTKSVWAMD